MLDLATLKAALAPIAAVGLEELPFDVEGHTLTLRPLLPREEVAVQRYAQEFLVGSQDEEGKTDRYAVMAYYDVFRTETLSHAIVQVDGLDLRDVDYIATGEVTATNKPVRVPRHVALRSLLKEWSRTLTESSFGQYTALLTRVEENAEKLVQHTPADLDTEIERLKERLKNLKDMRLQRAKGDANLMARQVRAINELGKAQHKTPEPHLEPSGSVQDPVHEEPNGRSPVPYEGSSEPPVEQEPAWATYDEMPTRAALNDRPPPLKPEPKPEPKRVTAPIQQPRPKLPNHALEQEAPPEVMDSFGDVDDASVLAAEQARIIQARQRAAAEQALPSRTPPHLRGRHPMGGPGISGGDIRAATPEELAAQGVPAHLAQPQDPTRTTLPGRAVGMTRDTETLSDRGRERARTQATESIPVNKGSANRRAQNPNFRGPK